jgi:hypothetical protein
VGDWYVFSSARNTVYLIVFPYFLAQAIIDSLTLLTSLRPRTTDVDSSPLLPSPAVLHALQLTFPLQSTPGWHGTLPPGNSTALRDDNTARIRPGTASAPATEPAAPAPAATPISTNSMAVPTYTWPYAATGTIPYRGAATVSTPYSAAYKQNQSYFPTIYAATQTSSYYGAQGFSLTTGQQPYTPYGSWYSGYAGTQSATPVAASRKGTPQPATGTSTPLAANYTAFFNTTVASMAASVTPPPARPAIANTAVGRAAAAQATPGTAPTIPTLKQNGTYFGAYNPATQ